MENKKALVYLDCNNLFHLYKKLDFAKLKKFLDQEYDIIRAIAYNSVDNRNDNQRKFLVYMANNGWVCKTFDLMQTTNIDNVIVSDMHEDRNNFDHKTIVLISCDGDYKYSLEKLSCFGYKIHVIGSKDNTSIHLQAVADKITYLENIGIVLEG